MRLAQLRYFKAVVERGSFNGASRALNISQPAITAAIKALEDEIGAPLLIRASTRNVRLSPFGAVVYKDICDFLRHLDTMVQSWQPAIANAPLIGELRILAYPTIAVWLVEYILPVITKMQPDLNIVIEYSSSGGFEANMKAYRSNLGIFAQLAGDDSDEVKALRKNGYTCTALTNDEFVVCLGVQHLKASHACLSPDDWQKLSFCTTPSYGHFWPPLAHPVLGHRSGKNKYFGNRETLLHNLEKGDNAAIFLEKMMARHWTVLEGRLVLKKFSTTPLYPCQHILGTPPTGELSRAELWCVNWLEANYARFADLQQQPT